MLNISEITAKHFCIHPDIIRSIEKIILRHSIRGMDTLHTFMTPGYTFRAAKLLLESLEASGNILIATGFPILESYETDGPIGAIALYNVMKQLGGYPVFVCADPLAAVLEKKYTVCKVPIATRNESKPIMEGILKKYNPSCIVSIERPGAASDGNYYTMKGVNITQKAAKLDILFEAARCPTIGIGDGGNEIGMGNVIAFLNKLPITPSVITCDELVIATVSNWGVYGMITLLSMMVSKDLFTLFNPMDIMKFLVAHNSLDGITGISTHTEDAFHVSVSMGIIDELRNFI